VGLYLHISIYLRGVHRDNFTFTSPSYVSRRHYRSVIRHALNLSRRNMALCCKSRRVFDLVKRSSVSSHHTSGPTKKKKKARRLAWSVLLTPGDYVATSCKDRNIINTASSFCCATASRRSATAEQVTVLISRKRSQFRRSST
jgi:hypothetical protein